MNPHVSIILSVFNGEGFLADTIKSVLCQTYENFEFIIVNDGSTDNSDGIIRSFSDKRIRYFPQSHIGFASALNFGLDKSTGRFIARIDADDCWVQDKLDIQIKYLEKHPEINFLASSKQIINLKGKVLVKCEPNKDMHDQELKDKICEFNCICHSSVLFNKNIIRQIGNYNTEFHNSLDYEYWVRIIKNYKAHLIGKPLVKYRIHPNMLTLANSRQQNIESIRIKLNVIHTYGFKIKYIKFLLHNVARILFPSIFTEYMKLQKRS